MDAWQAPPMTTVKKTLLVVDASARVARSVTRGLTARYVDLWREAHPGGQVIHRDVGIQPPPPLGEAWIEAAYAPAGERTPEMVEALVESEILIREIERADGIVMGVPMYNFGIPSQLKVWFEQIIRVGRTFDFAREDEAHPYRPLLAAKPVVVVTSAGAAGYGPGGRNAAVDFLKPQLHTMLDLIGLPDATWIRVESAGAKDGRYVESLAAAERMVERLAAFPATQS
jgi:FMN-dependent NADH-azoreductase